MTRDKEQTVYKNNYAINLHSHTFFSDGANSPYVMAQTAQQLKHTALVITDHFCAHPVAMRRGSGLNEQKYRLLKRACKEATTLLPVIIGVELAIEDVEMLVFSSGLINKLMCLGREPTIAELLQWKKDYYAAFVLCHPSNPKNWDAVISLLDGFEQYNAGVNCFQTRDYDTLQGLTRWCNSDAHSTTGTGMGWNLVDSNITKEQDLIKYLRSGKQPDFLL